MCDHVCAIADSASFGKSRLTSLAGSGSGSPAAFTASLGAERSDDEQDTGRGGLDEIQSATVAKALKEVWSSD